MIEREVKLGYNMLWYVFPNEEDNLKGYRQEQE